MNKTQGFGKSFISPKSYNICAWNFQQLMRRLLPSYFGVHLNSLRFPFLEKSTFFSMHNFFLGPTLYFCVLFLFIKYSRFNRILYNSWYIRMIRIRLWLYAKVDHLGYNLDHTLISLLLKTMNNHCSWFKGNTRVSVLFSFLLQK